MERKQFNNLGAGANNLAHPSRLPEGAARQITNMDVMPGGVLSLRPDAELAAPAANVRALCAYGNRLIYVTGRQLWLYDPAVDQGQQVAELPDDAPVVMAEFLDSVFIQAGTTGYEYHDGALYSWGQSVPELGVQVIGGTLPAGLYRVAATVTDGRGRESGGDPLSIQIAGGQGIRISPLAAGNHRFYCTTANGDTLYAQGNGSVLEVTHVRTDTERLTTTNATPMPEVAMLVAGDTGLVGARENHVFGTEPMRPHLVHRVMGYASFPSEVVALAPVRGGGVFVCTATEVFFLTGLGTPAVATVRVADFGAVPGTAVRLPTGEAAWFSAYGQVIGGPDGSITTPNRTTYAPTVGAVGVAGVSEHNGRQAVITSMRGGAITSGMAVGDHWEIKVK